MLKYSKFPVVILFVLLIFSSVFAMGNKVSSPDGRLSVTFKLNAKGTPLYSVKFDGKDAIRPSRLGLVLDKTSFAENLTLESNSKIEKVNDRYTMLSGKQKQCNYTANRRVFTLTNEAGNVMQIIFQVSNDGVAFRYALPGDLNKPLSVTQEKTAFSFDPTTISWLHPMPAGKSGWCKTQPSYEEHYVVGPVGQPSPLSEGWCFPALFKTVGNVWVLICDSDVDENYCATRLAKDSKGGVYNIAFPHIEEHRGDVDPIAPVIATPFQSPWRVLIIGDTLNTLVSSTLMTDVAAPCKLKDTDFIKPGKAAWHWIRYGDESATLEYANMYLDFAAKMKWQYILVDCTWDKRISYEQMAEFVSKANAKNVDVILWYNSNGPWNTASMTPRDKMHDRNIRRKEFAILQKMGVKGVKVDFFGGDKQATMKLYLDIFKDAADYGIMVNCHGTTIPRGWQRTYPNLATMESVKGMEYCTFEQKNADLQPQHCCILPFSRNVIGSMDFTPTMFNSSVRKVKLVTTPVFELALSIVFESGIQHFALSPDESSMMPDFVVEFLQKVPVAWDETRLVDGYPGEFTVIARRSGDTWYIGGINGTGKEKQVTLDLSFLAKDAIATMISDGPNRTFVKTGTEKTAMLNPTISMSSNGGFVMVIK